MGTQPFPETQENFHSLTRLSAREHFIEFCRHESFKAFMKPRIFLGGGGGGRRGSLSRHVLICKEIPLFTINSCMFRRLYESHYKAKPP
jgi:hypothetical protein